MVKMLLSILILSILIQGKIVPSEEDGKKLFAESETRFTELIEAKGTIHVKPNSKFAFTIVSNPTTGYEWNLHQGSIKGAIESLDQGEHGAFDASGSHAGWVGAPGHQTFTFAANEEGIEKVEFTYEAVYKHEGPRGHYTLEIIITN